MIEVFGDSAWHVIVDKLPERGMTPLRMAQRAGGPAVTVAMQAAMLGAHVTFSGTLGADDAGDRIARELGSVGVRIGTVAREGRTATVLAAVGSGDLRLGVHLADVAPPSLPELPTAAICYVTGFPPMTPFLQRCARAGIRVVTDLGFVPHLEDENAFERHLDDIGGAVGIGVLSGEGSRGPARRAAERLVAAGATAVIITLGKDGVELVQSSGALALAAPKVEAKDVLCAGDCFVAGLLVGLDRDWSLPDSIVLGQATAAAKVSRFAELADKELVSQLVSGVDERWH